MNHLSRLRMMTTATITATANISVPTRNAQSVWVIVGEIV